jgi:hypothetical protein
MFRPEPQAHGVLIYRSSPGLDFPAPGGLRWQPRIKTPQLSFARKLRSEHTVVWFRGLLSVFHSYDRYCQAQLSDDRLQESLLHIASCRETTIPKRIAELVEKYGAQGITEVRIKV